MNSPQRTMSLAAAAVGATQRGTAFANAVAANLSKAAADLPPEDAIRFNTTLARAERLAREFDEIGREIKSLFPAAVVSGGAA